MELQSLARKHSAFDGKVTFWLLPHHTLGSDVAYQTLKSVEPEEHWSFGHNVYVMAVPLTVDIEFADELNPELERLKMFWTQRSGGVIDNWQRFNQLLTTAIVIEWYDAFEATRLDANTAGPPELAEDVDEKTDPEDSGGDSSS